MGAVCHRPEHQSRNEGKSRRKNTLSKISQSLPIPGVEFVTEGQAKNLKADCLFVFFDPRAEITENKILKLYGEHVPAKVKQFMEAREDGSIIAKQVGDCQIFPVAIRNFPYTKVAILFIEIWEGDNTDFTPTLQQYLEKAFYSLPGQQISSLVLAQIGQQFGFPSHQTQKALAASATKLINSLDLVIFLCPNEDSQVSLSESIRSLMTQSTTDPVQETKRPASSVYY